MISLNDIRNLNKAKKHTVAVFVKGQLVYVADKATVEGSIVQGEHAMNLKMTTDPYAGTILAADFEKLGIGFEDVPNTPKPRRKKPMTVKKAAQVVAKSSNKALDKKVVDGLNNKTHKVPSLPARDASGHFIKKSPAKARK